MTAGNQASQRRWWSAARSQFAAKPAESRELILFAVATGSAAMINISIAATQILLAIGVVLLLIFRRKVRFPGVGLPLLLFFLWSAVSDALCPNPAAGYPYLRKAFDFLFIPLIYAAPFHNAQKAVKALLIWIGTGAVSGIYGLVQYVGKYEHAKHSGQQFYVTYLERRITGFQSHWMTFGALQLAALTIALSFAFFSKRRLPPWGYAVMSIFLLGIYLSWDRSIWLATLIVFAYLVWFWRPKLILLVPVAAAFSYFFAPTTTRARMESLVHPHGDTDSNRFRVVTFETGLQMIKAHPWFGIGPPEIAREFNSYVPADIKRPLPVGYYGHLHNMYVEYAAERGIPALIFILWFIAVVVRKCVKGIGNAATQSKETWLLHATIAVVIGILVGGLFEHNLGDSEVLMMFLFMIGIALSALSTSEERANLA